MEPTTPPVDLVQAATQVYELSRQLEDGHEESLRVAIQSVLEVHRAQILSEAADVLQKYADDLESDDDESDHDLDVAVSYITYTTELIRKLGHPEIEISTYVPKNGDLIQVIATGMVTKLKSFKLWTVTLDRGDLLDFDLGKEEPGVRVRLLDRAEDEIDEEL